MTRPLILLDCDGVLADFVTPALRVVAELGGPTVAHDDLTQYDIGQLLPAELRAEFWRRVAVPGFCAGLKPYPGALECVFGLREIGDVVCVTSPMDAPHWAHERIYWLKEFFGFDRKTTISTSGKHWIAGDFLADDSIGHVDDWANHHASADGPLRGCLIKRPWNGGDTTGMTLPDFVAHVRRWQ